MSGSQGGRRAAALAAGLLLALLLLYTAVIHHGVGPRPAGGPARWYDPRGFLFGWELLAPLLAGPARAVAGLGGVAAALAVAVAIAGRSALATALAAACVVAVALFAFYGVQADFVWRFFHWRGSAVIATTALVVGVALAAPLLAASWLRLSRPWRVAVYLPFFAVPLALLRNATGTDPSLRFGLSPWPAVPVFGLAIGAAFAAIAFAAAALGSGALARAQTRSGVAALGLGGAGVGLALALPALLLALGAAAGLFPFQVGGRTLAGASLGAALLLAAVAGHGWPRGAAALARRARALAVAAALVALPLLAGHGIARADYRITREERAGAIIDALAAYYERERLYPDSLEELVASADLPAVPKPRIGFLRDADFQYQNFGTSYVLEFSAPGWVQCAYNPPWEDDEADAEAGDDEPLGGAWSCPTAPPELW